MKSRWRPRLLTSGVLLLCAFAVWVWLDYRRNERVLADYQRQLISAGEKLAIEALIPQPPPDEGNGTVIFAQAELLISGRGGALMTNPPVSMRMVAPGRAIAGWQQADIRDAQVTNSWAEVHNELNSFSEAFALLHQLIERPHIDHRLDYASGHLMNSGSRLGFSTAGRRLDAAILCSLRDRELTEAVTHARAILALVKGWNEPLVLSQQMRISIGNRAFRAHWELLQSRALTEDQLLTLQRAWEELEFLQSLEQALKMERAFTLLAAEEMRRSGKTFEQFSSPWYGTRAGTANNPSNWSGHAWRFATDSWGKVRNQAKRTAWRVAWADEDQLVALQGMQATLDGLRHARQTGAFLPALRDQNRRLETLGFIGDASIADDAGDGFNERNTRTLLSQTVTLNHRMLQRVMVMETSRNMMLANIALKRHKLRHGRLPVDLAGLTTELLAAIPRDPVDGHPLRFRHNDDGSFLLYSVGEDGVDDGGDPRPANEASKSLYWGEGRDWVWPQPASAEEVELFHRKLDEPNR